MAALFVCNNCGETFHNDGLHLTVHSKAIAHICPSCLVGTKTVQLSLERPGPAKPFEFQLFQVVNDYDSEDDTKP